MADGLIFDLGVANVVWWFDFDCAGEYTQLFDDAYNRMIFGLQRPQREIVICNLLLHFNQKVQASSTTTVVTEVIVIVVWAPS